jgi:class 3 adenylate cyclase
MPGCHDIDVSDRAAIDELLDRAVAAINQGDRQSAATLAAQVLSVDHDNVDANDLLGAPSGDGEIRRLTILFADLVDSTVLSTRVEPETYHLLVGRYRQRVLEIVDQYEGHIGSTAGDGLLAVFGHPVAHEDDARRAVQAGLEITRAVARLAEQARRRFGLDIAVRVGVHRGLVYLDIAHDDVYGLAANLAARVSGLAPAGTLVVSDAVEPLIRNTFDLQARPAAPVKGVDGLIDHHLVLGERVETRVRRGLLLGRDRELEHLRKCWTRAATGTLTTPGVVLRGEAGIGKSRLAAAAAELAEQSGSTVLELTGSPFHVDAGLYPVRTLLERRCGITRQTDARDRLRLLENEVRVVGLDPNTAVPLLTPVLGIGETADYEQAAAEGAALYRMIAESVQAYLLACFAGAPGLVVVEDAHWFDHSTLEVVASVLRASQGRLLSVITTRRPVPVDLPVDELELKPLTDRETDALISALDPGLSAEHRAAVADRCDGVPFYIEQVVTSVGEAGVPDALYEPLFARLRAHANAVQVLEAAAVIGRYVERGLLFSVVGLSDDEVDDVLDELERAQVLERSGTDTWRFRHELLREVAGELAPPSVRRGLHAKVAEALIGGGADPDWLLVARHYELADRHGDAAAAFQQASADARRRGALIEACTYLSRALTQLEQCEAGPDRDRRELATRLERGFLTAAAETYVSPAVAADFERCLQLGGTDLRDDKLFATLTPLAGHYSARADVDRLLRMVELMRAGLHEGRQWLQPVVDGANGVAEVLRGNYEVARGFLERAVADWAANPHELDSVWFVASDPIASIYQRLAVVRMVQGDLAGADAELARAMQRADSLGFPQAPFSAAFTRFAASMISVEAGQLAKAARLADEILTIAELHGMEGFRVVGIGQRAAVDGLAEIASHPADAIRLDARITTFAGVVDAFRAVELYVYIGFFYGVLARLLVAAGDYSGAQVRLAEGLQIGRETGAHFYDAELIRLRAATHAATEDVRSDLAAALELARGQRAPLFELRAALDHYRIDGVRGRAVLAEAAARMHTPSSCPEALQAKAILEVKR